MADIYCTKCKRTLKDSNFYTHKDGTKCQLCKSCYTMFMNAYKPDTFLWGLKEFDVPYIEPEWNKTREKEFSKPKKGGNANMTTFGKYLSKMKMVQWNKYTWADTDRLKEEAELKAKLNGEINAQRMADMEESFKNGEISEAQWMTFKEINDQPQEPEFKQIGTIITTEGGNGYPANIEETPFEIVNVPDVGNELTDEDKIYLAMKWGKLYAPSDWVYLEKKYNDFMDSFEIQGAARLDTLIQICKLSLKMNQSLDAMDMDSYSKLSRAYDTLMKSAKFTEAQRKEEKTGEFNCFGLITAYAESKKGHIERLPLDIDRDIVDRDIRDIKNYNRSLIDEDPAIFKLIEQYIKKKETIDQQEKDLAEARANGEEYVHLTDNDLAEWNKSMENDNEEEDEE